MEIDQRKLLADLHLQECKTYKWTVENGQITGDSALIYITKYNTNGCAVQGIGLDSAHTFVTRWTREYRYDTLLYKQTVYNQAQKIHAVDEYTYDSLGRLIQMQFQFFYYPTPRTTTLTMVYDQPKHHWKDTYKDMGDGKKLASREEYNDQGKVTKTYWNQQNGKKPDIQIIEYDLQNRPVRYYNMHKGKKKLAIENTYNPSGQWIARSRIERDNYTTHHDAVVYKVNQGDHLLVKYSYDPKGLVIRKMGYKNDVLIYQCGYTYL